MARLAANLKRWWAAYITWRRQQAAIDQLRSMSDDHLKDLGITRTDIVPVVKGEAVRGFALRRHRGSRAAVNVSRFKFATLSSGEQQ
jgi:uncharacterized protein YjiS (DUF1127 family)